MAPKYPAIPEPTTQPDSLRDASLSIKQAFEVLTGQRGNPDYRAVLLPELTSTNTTVAGNAAAIADNAAAIADNAAAIATNTTNIATNTANILNKVTKNYIINGAMMISQENGATSGFATGTAFFPVDDLFTLASNTSTCSSAQVASLTPAGSPNRLRITVTTPNASPAAADFCFFGTFLEGLRTADLKSGTA